MSIVAAYALPHPPLIIPSVGRGDERRIQATVDAYREVARRVAAHAPDTIIVSSPHAPAYYDAFAICCDDRLEGDMQQFRSSESMACNVDVELSRAIERASCDVGLPVSAHAWRGARIDHATFIPLYFVNEAYRDYQVVVVGLSGLSAHDHRVLGQVIAQQVSALGRHAVYLASGDLSHKLRSDGPYGYVTEGPTFDRLITEAFWGNRLDDIFSFDPDLTEAAAECGLRSFQIMAGALDGVRHTGELLSYEGPFGVGYGVAAFEADSCGQDDVASQASSESAGERKNSAAEGLDALGEDIPSGQSLDPYVSLARQSFTAYTKDRRHIAIPEGLPAEMMSTRAGAFVSLHLHGELRGCIGTLAPVRENVAEEIICNAIAACSEDPRFPPVTPDELPFIECSVDVLGDAEDVDGLDQLDVKRYGVIVTHGWHRGVLLPDLQGVDTVDAQVAIAKQKAGIPQSADCKLQRFEVVRHR